MKLPRQHTVASERIVLYGIAFAVITITAMVWHGWMRAMAQDNNLSVNARGLATPDNALTDAGQRTDKPLGPATSLVALMQPAAVHDSDTQLSERKRVDGREVNLLARACFVEATGSEADCAAIDAVITRRAARAGMTYATMMIAYSAVGRSQRVPTEREWARHINIAERVLSGEIRNTCIGADHFGGMRLPRDHRNATKMIGARKWAVVKCTARVANTYFRERGAR